MGVLNVTPDSFSDGGLYQTDDQIARAVERLVADGADLIDVGAESTRPGSLPVPAEEQLRRLESVFRRVRSGIAGGVPVTVDTTRAVVAEAALASGFAGVNDVSGGTDDPEMLATVARCGAAYIAMHMQGRPLTMQASPAYGPQGVVQEVGTFLAGRVAAAMAAGISRERLLTDPGIGFGKTDVHNLLLLKHLETVETLAGVPLLVGTSRKGFLGRLTGRDDPKDRRFGTASTVAWAARCGVAVVRVHDVADMRDVLRVWQAIEQADGLDAP